MSIDTKNSEKLELWLAGLPLKYRNLYHELRRARGNGKNYFPISDSVRMVEQQMQVDARRAARAKAD